MLMLDPELLRAFVAVAGQGSFTRAATALHRTQSAVSMQIKRLELQLELSLFHRSKSQVRLSPAGERLLDHAHRILALNQEAVARVREHEIAGTVRLGVMDDYGTLLLPPLLASFAAGHRRIEVQMETGLTAGMTERLGKDFDLVIAMHPAGQGAGGELLRRERAVWAAGSGPGVEGSTPLPLALYPQGCLFRRWAIEALDAAGRPWRLAFVSHSLAAVEAVVAHGLAVTVVKAGTFPPRLRRLSVRDGLPPLPVAEIRLHRARHAPAAAVLLADHLRAGLVRRARQATA